MLKDLVSKCRTYRRFYQDCPITKEDLIELIDLARLTASTANSQALKFKISNTPEENALIFDTLGWAEHFLIGTGPRKGSAHLPTSSFSVICHLVRTSLPMMASSRRP